VAPDIRLGKPREINGYHFLPDQTFALKRPPSWATHRQAHINRNSIGAAGYPIIYPSKTTVTDRICPRTIEGSEPPGSL
jgi:hypothetical protein